MFFSCGLFVVSTYAKSHWTESERLSYLPIMHENIVSNMKLLIEYVRVHSKKRRPADQSGSSTGGGSGGGSVDPYYQLPPVPAFDSRHDDMAHTVSELRKDEISGVPLQAIRSGLTPLLDVAIVEVILHYYGMDLGPIWDKIAALVRTVLFSL